MHPADVFVSQNSVAQFSMAILAGLAIAAPVGPIGIICLSMASQRADRHSDGA